MARILITGSSDGLGRMAAELLISQGDAVVLHARNAHRAEDARRAVPDAAAVVTGDFASIAETRGVAEQANRLGRFDAVIHNAAIGYRERQRVLTVDGLSHVFAINSLAPYILTALMEAPARLVYISSELHRRAAPNLDDLNWERRPWQGNRAYSESKVHNVLLAFGVARLWPGTLSNAIEPGWVPTRMGGPKASGDLDAAPRTQVWLATSADPAALVTGEYFFHEQLRKPNPATRDIACQEEFLAACHKLSGVLLPRA